jgi:hypothetical protein
MALYAKALAIHREVGNRRFEGWTLYGLARVQRRCLGNLEAAQDSLQSAENLFRALGEPMWTGCCLCERGHVLLAMGRSGREWLDEAEAIARSLRLGENSDLSKAASALARAQNAFDANQASSVASCWRTFRLA